MNMNGAMLLEAATELARRTGRVALKHFRATLTVDTKSDGSPVTLADRAAEQAARAWIASRFPGDGVLGEEFGVDRPEAPRRWILDPIDGTKTFVRGVPLWGTLVAVCEGESVLAGAAYFPALDEMLAAAPGLGCWWNGVRCHVSSTRALNEATVLTTDERFAGNAGQRSAWLRLADASAISRTWGDCYGYLLVATGRAEVMVDGRMSPWDCAAVMPAIIEAGGSFTDWTGRTTAFGTSAIATNAALAETARSLLGVSSASEAMSELG